MGQRHKKISTSKYIKQNFRMVGVRSPQSGKHISKRSG